MARRQLDGAEYRQVGDPFLTQRIDQAAARATELPV
jgi:hypothetical protein